MSEKKIEFPQKVIRRPALLEMVGMSAPTIWRMERDGQFPKRIRLGSNSCGWLLSEVNAWLEGRAAARG